jgi:hypothetical protein
MILIPLLLLAQPAVAQSLRERIEAEATELVVNILSDTIETTLISEGRESAFATCVGQFVAKSFKEATDEQRENGMRYWIDDGKRKCDLLVASANPSQAPQ